MYKTRTEKGSRHLAFTYGMEKSASDSRTNISVTSYRGVDPGQEEAHGEEPQQGPRGDAVQALAGLDQRAHVLHHEHQTDARHACGPMQKIAEIRNSFEGVL